MHDAQVMIRLDDTGVVRVGHAGVPLDEIVKVATFGNSQDTVFARFPMLSREEIKTAIAYNQLDADSERRGPRQRDVDWRRWRQTAAEELGTDLGAMGGTA